MDIDFDLGAPSQARGLGIKRKNDGHDESHMNPSKLLKIENHESSQLQCGHNFNSIINGISQITIPLYSLRDINGLCRAYRRDLLRVNDDQKREIEEIKKLVIHATDVFIDIFRLIGNVSLHSDKIQSIEQQVNQEVDTFEQRISFLVEKFSQVSLECELQEHSG